MCARATLKSPDRLEELRELGVTFPGGLKPRYNITPTQPITAVRIGSDGRKSVREKGVIREKGVRTL
jgi:putative SOS response-associated peptidase YedK